MTATRIEALWLKPDRGTGPERERIGFRTRLSASPVPAGPRRSEHAAGGATGGTNRSRSFRTGTGSNGTWGNGESPPS